MISPLPAVVLVALPVIIDNSAVKYIDSIVEQISEFASSKDSWKQLNELLSNVFPSSISTNTTVLAELCGTSQDPDSPCSA